MKRASLTEFENRLRSAGVRVTAGRLAVLAAVHSHPHGTAETIAVTARWTSGSLSTQAVYDNLHALVEAKLVRRTQPAGHAARFETRIEGHNHLICRNCGATEDIDLLTLMPLLAAKDAKGFAIDETEINFWGLCPSCKTSEA